MASIYRFPYTEPFPYYTGRSSISIDVPNKWPCSLNGHNLVLDIKGENLYQTDRWKHASIELLRQQQDTEAHPGEHSLNPQGLWRRAQDSWHHGAGQIFRDRGLSGDPQNQDDYRFRSSKGIDVWTYWQMSLLPDTTRVLTSANTNLFTAVAGSRLYVTDGTAMRYTTDGTSYTVVTGTPGVAFGSITSDGFNVWASCAASGIYSTNTGTGAAAQYTSGNVSGPIAYVKGRLLAADANSLYNIVTGGAAVKPAALFTQANTNFTWVGFAGGPQYIYAAGFSGDKSLIYKTTIKTDGTALDAPSVAGELPDGEIIRSIDSYLGNILIGTDKGCRYATADGTGNLIIGTAIPTTAAVLSFEGQGPYVWFGWTNYDSTSTGLGRLDLRQFTETLETGARVPAYASDLMATAQGATQAVNTFLDKRFFTVSGSGVWTHSTNLVASGTLDTGLIGYGLPDYKLAISTNIKTLPLVGSYNAFVAVDSGAFTNIGAAVNVGTTDSNFPMSFSSGERFEVRFVLTRAGGGTTGPTITRWTLKVSPGALDGPAEIITAPFLLHEIVDINGREEHLNVQFERDSIKLLRRTQEVIVYQEGSNSYDVQVMDYIWIPYDFTVSTMGGGFGSPNGTMVTQLKRLN